MTSINDIAEDPTGFRIEPTDLGWQWVRLADEVTEDGFDTREDAIADAQDQSREPEEGP